MAALKLMCICPVSAKRISLSAQAGLQRSRRMPSVTRVSADYKDEVVTLTIEF